MTVTPLLLALAGGSGSGKTALASTLVRLFGEGEASIFGLDAYYQDLGHLGIEERARVNFDHPDALDRDRLLEDLRVLARGDRVDIPVYDFSRHTRSPIAHRVEPTPVVIVEGLFSLHWPRIRELFDLAVFVDTDEDLCLERRLRRDVRERGRDPDCIRAQYEATVRPMYRAHVGPTRRHADLIVDGSRAIVTSAVAVLTRLNSLSTPEQGPAPRFSRMRSGPGVTRGRVLGL